MAKFLRTVGVAYLYFPHVWLMRLVGPHGAVLLARLTAWCHWLITFAGTNRRLESVIRTVEPHWEADCSPRSVLRRHLETKHQNFAEWYVYPTARGRRYVQSSYASVEGKEHLTAALAEGRGAIVLVFHFGLVKMAFPALQALGHDVHQHVYRGATYTGMTYDWMARLAMRRLAGVDEASGLKMIYHRPLTTLVTMLRVLRRGGLIGINADGMMGDEFVEIPFLGSTIRLPAGPAQLAAQSGAPIVPLFIWSEGIFRRRIVLHEPMYPSGTSPDAIEDTVRQYGDLLERYVRKYPWAWWTLRRLQLEKSLDGEVRFAIAALKTDEANSIYRPPDLAGKS